MVLLEINYQKRKNRELFKELEGHPELSMELAQNYSPIYKNFFNLNDTNYNNVNLNHPLYIFSIRESLKETNSFSCVLKHVEDNSEHIKPVFFKLAPLVDPFKFMMGKYPISTNMFNLPTLTNESDVNNKLKDANNSSYVDGFFSFLSSKLSTNGFIHGVDYYGSFLGIKKNFSVNVIDDIDYLVKSDFFNKNKNVLFDIQDYSHLMLDDDCDTNKKLNPIQIHDNISNFNETVDFIDETLFEELFVPTESLSKTDFAVELTEMNMDDFSKYDTPSRTNSKSLISSSSSCSSRTSYTSNEEDAMEDPNGDDGTTDENRESLDKEDDEEGSGEDDETEGTFVTETDSDMEEETLYATITKFPVQMIAMEKCENTLDNLIINTELENHEWLSIFMQIIMTLLTYQKVYSFTHNDLHTNNIMYNTTDKKYIYYLYKNTYYKVPTYGKIFKIIDFGRSIYKFNEITFCSDSFQSGGDAATQYNCEPYMNNSKPRLDPNYSFDLCRLACSMFDYVVEDISEVKELTKKNPYIRIIVDWCTDDNGINVLYKNNGAERYPEFKLYKMIARHVHKHTPAAQLERKEFSSFVVNKKNMKSVENIINIDELCKLSQQ